MARLQYYIVSCRNPEYNSPDFAAINMGNDPGYAELLQLERDKKLKSEHPTVVPRSLFETNTGHACRGIYR